MLKNGCEKDKQVSLDQFKIFKGIKSTNEGK